MDSTAQRYSPSTTPDTEPRAPHARRRRVRRATVAALTFAGLVALYALLGFLVLPAYLETKIPDAVSAQLGLPVTVNNVRFNPFTFALTIEGFDISEPDKSPLVGFDELLVNLSLSSVINRAWTFDHIRLRVPYARAIVREDGGLNLRELQPQAHAASSETVEDRSADRTSIPAVIIHELHVENGAVEFHDRSRPTPYSIDIVPIWFALKNFRTLHAQDNAFAFGAEFDVGETVTWQGRLLLNPFRSEGRVALSGIKVRDLWEYIRDTVEFEIRDGLLHAEASYQVEGGPDGLQANARDGSVRLENLTLFEKGTETRVMALPAFSVQGVEADLHERRTTIAKVESHGATLQAAIEKDGRTNLQRLLTSTKSAQAVPAPARRVSASAESTSSPWTVLLQQLVVDDYAAVIEDRRPPSPVQIDLSKLHLDLEHAAYPGTTPARLAASVSINNTGTVTADGEITISPLTADLRLDLAKVPLVPFQPYVGELAHLELKSGTASAAGQVRYASGETASIRFHGDAGVAQFKTVDAHLKKDFLNWDALTVSKIDARLPGGVTVGEVVARRPYADLIIAADRTINLKTIMKKSGNGAAGSAPEQVTSNARPSASTAIKIGAVRIIDGSAHFADFSIQPQVDTGIYRLNGSIRGLSSQESARAKVALHGEVDKYAPVTIAGTINPLSSDAFTDVHLSFKNVNLTTLSPYSTKFAGYPIEKGKLSMELDYRLAHRHLEAENDVVIDQLTLGKKADSPDATSLPVKLIVALLKDRHGRINIDLPVRGDLNDPDFHYGKLLWNVMVNLFQKAVASPFAWLGSLVGTSGEELSRIRFPAGSAELPSESEDKLKALAKSLEDRPALQLEVTGTADPTVDRTVLREVKFQQQLAAVRHASTAGQSTGRRPGNQDKAKDDDTRWIEALYVRTFGALPQPSTNGESRPEATTDVLRTRLLEAITIDDGDLRRLAHDRAARVQDFLINRLAVPAERIFVLDARIDEHAQDDRVATTLNLTAS